MDVGLLSPKWAYVRRACDSGETWVNVESLFPFRPTEVLGISGLPLSFMPASNFVSGLDLDSLFAILYIFCQLFGLGTVGGLEIQYRLFECFDVLLHKSSRTPTLQVYLLRMLVLSLLVFILTRNFSAFKFTEMIIGVWFIECMGVEFSDYLVPSVFGIEFGECFVYWLFGIEFGECLVYWVYGLNFE